MTIAMTADQQIAGPDTEDPGEERPKNDDSLANAAERERLTRLRQQEWRRQTLAVSLHYLVALIVYLIATLVRVWLDPILGDNSPFATYTFAIVFIAWY